MFRKAVCALRNKTVVSLLGLLLSIVLRVRESMPGRVFMLASKSAFCYCCQVVAVAVVVETKTGALESTS